MSQINVQDAKTRLSDLLARAERGEDIVIARAGKPIVRLVPVEPVPQRMFGRARFSVPPDFDAPLDEGSLASWE